MPSSSHSGSGSSRGGSPGSRQPRVRTDVVENVRVLDQSAPNPYKVPLIPSTTQPFRVVIFSLHLAMSMLESPRGRQALIEVGTAVWDRFRRRGRRNFALQGDLSQDPYLITRHADQFIQRCRIDPPNVIVSDRILGEGLAERVNWPNMVHKNAGVYSPKWAAMFRVNKTV